MLAGHGLRDEEGNDNGVRVLDLDLDGYMDVLIANSKARKCRIWNPVDSSWKEIPFPERMHPGLRFGFDDKKFKTFAFSADAKGELKAWSFQKDFWIQEDTLTRGLERVASHSDGRDAGVRFRDIDRDGTCELIAGSPSRPEVYQLKEKGWELLPFSLPKGTSIVTSEGEDAGLRFADLDQDGLEDVIFSNSESYGTWLFKSFKDGWSLRGIGGKREAEVHQQSDHPLSFPDPRCQCLGREGRPEYRSSGQHLGRTHATSWLARDLRAVEHAGKATELPQPWLLRGQDRQPPEKPRLH